MNKVATPIHDAIPHEYAEAIMQFLGWLEEKGYVISEYCFDPGYTREMLRPVYLSQAQYIVESAGYDYEAWLAEKDAVLQAIRTSEE